MYNHYALVIIAHNNYNVFSPSTRILILRTNHYGHIFSVTVEHTVQK